MVRNPFDIIATGYIYGGGGSNLRSKLSGNPNMTLPTEERVLDCKIEHHAMEISALASMANQQYLNIHKVYIEELIRNPKEEILKLCEFLELKCSQKYIDNCVAAIFKSSSYSRYKLQWTQRQINRVIELINITPYLHDKYPPVF